MTESNDNPSTEFHELKPWQNEMWNELYKPHISHGDTEALARGKASSALGIVRRVWQEMFEDKEID